MRVESAINGQARSPLAGHTRDISTGGISLIVPHIRIGEQYLAGDRIRLQVQLQLPDGPVTLQAEPVRYESLAADETDFGYLIGARIRSMSVADRERYESFVADLGHH